MNSLDMAGCHLEKLIVNCVVVAGLCASVVKDCDQAPAAGAAGASVTASVFAAGVAESCMDMSILPDGDAAALK